MQRFNLPKTKIWKNSNITDFFSKSNRTNPSLLYTSVLESCQNEKPNMYKIRVTEHVWLNRPKWLPSTCSQWFQELYSLKAPEFNLLAKVKRKISHKFYINTTLYHWIPKLKTRIFEFSVSKSDRLEKKVINSWFCPKAKFS